MGRAAVAEHVGETHRFRPGRARGAHVLAAYVVDVRRISGEEFRREYGFGMRVGAGGLWGGFGLLVTAKETLVMYVSRVDDLVLVRRASDRPLLITPEDPERFVRELHGT